MHKLIAKKMYRVKDVTKLILRKDEVLLEVKPKSSLILSPEQNENELYFDYLKIIAKGVDVEDYELGDLVLNIISSPQFTNMFINKGKTYVKMPRHAIVYAVKPDNIDLEL